MDTRRDQLQLLEHFISAINGDSARPQIAQLTELGLVELTRKRQGQNIYELFGKTSANSQGQSDIPSITIQDIKPTFLSEARVNNSTLIAGNEIEPLKGTNIKKKSINKAKDSDANLIAEETKSSNDSLITVSSQIVREDSSINKNSNKQEKSILKIIMNDNEEMVYSSMGFDPILLLEEIPKLENFAIQIIRPGEEKDNNKDKILRKNKNAIELDSTNPKEIISSKVEDNNLDLDLDLEKNDSISDDNISINEKNELNSTESKEVDEDPRRKRRRSSAS